MSKANGQIGGDHYKDHGGEEHWDFAWKHRYNQFEYCASKYVERYKEKNGLQDLEKALHHLVKWKSLVPSAALKNERSVSGIMMYIHSRKMNLLQADIFGSIHMGDIRNATLGVELLIEQEYGGGPGRTYVDPDLDQK